MNSIANPFQTPAVQQTTAVAQSDSDRAIQEVQAAMVIAKKFPRDPVAAMDRILQACTRPTLAENALYQYARGGADISDASIRLAEAIAQNWGNIQFGIRELSQANGESTVESFAWDLETNCKEVKVFQVPHIRYSKRGSKRLEDPRDIYEIVANYGARRLRACILGVIPKDVTEAAKAQCEQTLKASADVSPDAIQKMLTAFQQFGVDRDMIQERIQRRLDSITPALMVQLKKIYASLRDGMSNPGDWFKGTAEPSDAPNIDAMKGSNEKPAEKKAAKTNGQSIATSVADISHMDLAESMEELDKAWQDGKSLSGEQRAAWDDAYTRNKDRLT